ncbi:MAG TPA: helix-turn-helix transcriptional regulator [Solirubrobacteraceae bacterium]|jgi:transcriptional regulator with XRE-family HTH domain|nr:helix-turn-helix transcriptional regulator [Solirubrobacteraceae bacterium]
MVSHVSYVHEPADPFLAAQLKRLREEREITQEELAFDAGITSSALSRIERGLNSPGWTTVRRIADALEVSVADLAAEVEDLEEDLES